MESLFRWLSPAAQDSLRLEADGLKLAFVLCLNLPIMGNCRANGIYGVRDELKGLILHNASALAAQCLCIEIEINVNSLKLRLIASIDFYK
ncbi:MAG: hypothetical protein IJS08_19495 [Victivallales bacterium]|nr:hypothetical protein [Victivallales bacterium]